MLNEKKMDIARQQQYIIWSVPNHSYKQNQNGAFKFWGRKIILKIGKQKKSPTLCCNFHQKVFCRKDPSVRKQEIVMMLWLSGSYSGQSALCPMTDCFYLFIFNFYFAFLVDIFKTTWLSEDKLTLSQCQTPFCRKGNFSFARKSWRKSATLLFLLTLFAMVVFYDSTLLHDVIMLIFCRRFD